VKDSREGKSPCPFFAMKLLRSLALPPKKQLGSIEENPPLSPLRKPHSLIFLSPPRERIEVRGNDPIPFFTLTLTLSG
jgi:hypothetical protein